jgi:carotenoid cleavage dioxygenase-like enzyme
MTLSRRHALMGMAGLAGLALTPGLARAQQAPDWRLGFANAPPEGLGPEMLQRVRGRAPAGLAGVLYRNGPGQLHYPGGPVSHWFDGDGLVRRFAISDGAVRHTARFVQTAKRRAEQAAQAQVMPGFGTAGDPGVALTTPDDANAANTSILPVNGRIWALWEAGSPVAVDPETLETQGAQTLRPDLAHMPFLAHPKVEPSGRIWNLGVMGSRAVIWRLAADGTVEDAQPLALPRPDYIHDWAMTERHLLILLQPWTLGGVQPPFVDSLRWRGDEAMLILVIDKDDLTRRRVFEAPAMSFFHTGDAWEDEGGAIRVDLCVSADPSWTVGASRDMLHGVYTPGAGPELAEITLRPDGSVSVARTGVRGDFPQTDRRRQGQRRALTALVAQPAQGRPGETAVVLWDWERGAGESFDFGGDHTVEEMLMVPYGPHERDCWLIGTTLHLAAGATELHVLDARRMADGPLVTWRSAFAAPLGFHGAFVA